MRIRNDAVNWDDMNGLNKRGLTERQVSCLTMKAQGRNNEEIGNVLGIGPSTVARELYATYCALGVKNAPAAVAIGFSEGWLTLPVVA